MSRQKTKAELRETLGRIKQLLGHTWKAIGLDSSYAYVFDGYLRDPRGTARRTALLEMLFCIREKAYRVRRRRAHKLHIDVLQRMRQLDVLALRVFVALTATTHHTTKGLG